MSKNGTTTPVVTNPRDLKLHEVVSVFDALSDKQMAKMEASVRARGIDQPIVLWNGMIIDGRNRWIAACNVNHPFKPTDFREWDGDEDDLLDYVWEINAECRRHLTPSQLDAVGVEIMEIKAAQIASKAGRPAEGSRVAAPRRGRPKADASTEIDGNIAENNRLCDAPRNAAKEAAEKVGRSERQIREAARVKKASPDEFDKVKKGKKTVAQAKKDLGLERRKLKRPDGTPIVTVTKCDNPTRESDIAADHEERAAIRDQDSDDAWVEGLEPYQKLQGKLRDDFRYAAIAARHLIPDRKRFAQRLGEEMKGNRKTPPWFKPFVWALEQLPPDEWYCCPAEPEGCGGSGKQELPGEKPSDCPTCKGYGYLTR